MPGGLHPHSHVGSFPFQIAVKLLRFSFAVVQLPFAIFTTFCIYERDLLKARVIIHPIMIMFGSFLPSLSRRTITVYSGQGADIVMQSSPGPRFHLMSGYPTGVTAQVAQREFHLKARDKFSQKPVECLMLKTLRNMFNNRGFWQWNFAASKSFPLKEALHLQFRAEAFNLINHPNWGTLSNPLSSTFMMVTSKLGSRNL